MTAATRPSCFSARVCIMPGSAAPAGCRPVPRADFKTGDFSRFVDATGAQIPIFDPATTQTGRQRQLRPHAVSRKHHSGQPDQPRFGQNRGADAEPGPAGSANQQLVQQDRRFPVLQHVYVDCETRPQRLHETEDLRDLLRTRWRPRLINSTGWGMFANEGSRSSRRAGRTGGIPAPDRDQPNLAR